MRNLYENLSAIKYIVVMLIRVAMFNLESIPLFKYTQNQDLSVFADLFEARKHVILGYTCLSLMESLPLSTVYSLCCKGGRNRG